MGKPFKRPVISNVVSKASSFVLSKRVAVSDEAVEYRHLSERAPAFGVQRLIGWFANLPDQQLFGRYVSNYRPAPVGSFGNSIDNIKTCLLLGDPCGSLAIVSANNTSAESCTLRPEWSNAHFVTRTVHYPADARDFLYVNSYPRTVPAYEGVGLPFDVTESLIGKPCAEKTNEEKTPSRQVSNKRFIWAIFRLARGFCTFFVGGILVYNGGYGNRRLSRLGDVLFFIGWFLLLAPVRWL